MKLSFTHDFSDHHDAKDRLCFVVGLRGSISEMNVLHELMKDATFEGQMVEGIAHLVDDDVIARPYYFELKSDAILFKLGLDLS